MIMIITMFMVTSCKVLEDMVNPRNAILSKSKEALCLDLGQQQTSWMQGEIKCNNTSFKRFPTNLWFPKVLFWDIRAFSCKHLRRPLHNQNIALRFTGLSLSELSAFWFFWMYTAHAFSPHSLHCTWFYAKLFWNERCSKSSAMSHCSSSSFQFIMLGWN